MLNRTGRFMRTDRLLRSRDFKRVLESGERRSSRAFTIFLECHPRGLEELTRPQSKLGITVNKRVGNAVVRNRIKRQVREWFRQARLSLRGEKDIVVIVRPAANGLSSAVIVAMLDELTHHAGTAGINQMVVGS